MAKKQSITVVDGVLTCEYPTISKKLVVDLAGFSDEIRLLAMNHGFKQKFGDAASGKSAAEKFAEVQAIHASLLEGEWERTASPDLTPIILEAVSRIKKIPLAKLQAANPAEEKVKEWGSNGKVKAMILKIRAERAAKEAEAADEIEVEGI